MFKAGYGSLHLMILHLFMTCIVIRFDNNCKLSEVQGCALLFSKACSETSRGVDVTNQIQGYNGQIWHRPLSAKQVTTAQRRKNFNQRNTVCECSKGTRSNIWCVSSHFCLPFLAVICHHTSPSKIHPCHPRRPTTVLSQADATTKVQ